jgi:isoquinoline 1-oxidoreductase alpha subunit|tara:strand:- start:15488 stop:15955 length:468 start_codon:yes stop_codon:yes gene_type:complete
MSVKLSVNGKHRELDLQQDTPLLWVIRDELELKGTKFGCGIGQCGACTVHVDGVAIRSCITPVAAVEGRAVTTIEGLDAQGNHTLQKAWREAQAPQCGYCQSGQIMQAASLLLSNPSPTEAEIITSMNGNLCRCMAYGRIKQAIKIAAASEVGDE